MQDILTIIDEIAIKPYVVSTRKSSGLYPSAASAEYIDENKEKQVIGQCLRKLWYQCNDFPVEGEDTAESIDKRAIGEWFSENLVERFKQAGLFVAKEVPFYDKDTGVSGRIDIIIKDPYTAPKPPNRPQPNQLIGIEVKSTGGYHNIKGPIISTKDTPLMPSLEHILQVVLYLGYYQEFGLDRWLLIYQDRESMRKQWHKVTLNEKGSPVIVNSQQSVTLDYITLSGIKDRFKRLSKHLKENDIPDRDYTLQYTNTKLLSLLKSNKLNKTNTELLEKRVKKLGDNPDVSYIQLGDVECSWCPYKEICWSESPETKPIKQAIKPMEKQRSPEINIDLVI